MNKLNSMKDSTFKKNESNKENQIITESINESEKILCHHCGRTAKNGIRCVGICVADNDY